MKKVLAMLAISLLTCSIIGCGKSNAAAVEEEPTVKEAVTEADAESSFAKDDSEAKAENDGFVGTWYTYYQTNEEGVDIPTKLIVEKGENDEYNITILKAPRTAMDDVVLDSLFATGTISDDGVLEFTGMYKFFEYDTDTNKLFLVSETDTLGYIAGVQEEDGISYVWTDTHKTMTDTGVGYLWTYDEYKAEYACDDPEKYLDFSLFRGDVYDYNENDKLLFTNKF